MKPTQTGYSRLTIWPGGAAADGGVGVGGVGVGGVAAGGVGILRDGAAPVPLFCNIEQHTWRHVYLCTHTHSHTPHIIHFSVTSNCRASYCTYLAYGFCFVTIFCRYYWSSCWYPS